MIQFLLCGYLNLVYGTGPFLFIYFATGIFGFLLSCIAFPNAISVGSSGSILGVLTSWIIFIIFRWNKVPVTLSGNRNRQLIIVTISIAATLALSFSGYIDWAAHVGGATQGLLLGLLLFSYELDNPTTKVFTIPSMSQKKIVIIYIQYSYTCALLLGVPQSAFLFGPFTPLLCFCIRIRYLFIASPLRLTDYVVVCRIFFNMREALGTEPTVAPTVYLYLFISSLSLSLKQ